MRLGRYQLIRRIAVGGMAEIYMARETGLAGFQRRAVVKRILPELAQDEEFVQLFLDEARLAARLSHPNIVHIYELARDETTYYIAMEYVEGCDLGSLMAATNGPLPLGDALHITTAILDGLHFAHTLEDEDGENLGVVHRDINPSNVLLSVSGVVKIVDFGIAKARTKVSITVPGRVMGTFGYMSPEQATASPIDRRTDIFATGSVLYRMTTGREAFPPRAAYELTAGRMATLRPPREVRPDLPEEVEKLILTAMAEKREDRFQTAAEMRREVVAAGLKHGLAADPDLLAGLVRSFMPKGDGDEDEQASGPVPTQGDERPARGRGEKAADDDQRPSDIPTARGFAAAPDESADLSVEESSSLVRPDDEPSGLDLPLTREALIPDEVSVDLAGLEESVDSAGLRPDEEDDDALAATIDTSAGRSVDIVDDAPRDTLVDGSDTLDEADPPPLRSLESVVAPAVEGADSQEPTIDERSTSVEVDLDAEDAPTELAEIGSKPIIILDDE